MRQSLKKTTLAQSLTTLTQIRGQELIIGLITTAFLLCSSVVYAESYVATAYDLSPQSCGKARDHWAYGVTASGYNLKGHTWDSARTVSADLSVLPLGTQLYITFPDPYGHMSGTYTVYIRYMSGIKADKYRTSAEHIADNDWRYIGATQGLLYG